MDFVVGQPVRVVTPDATNLAFGNVGEIMDVLPPDEGCCPEGRLVLGFPVDDVDRPYPERWLQLFFDPSDVKPVGGADEVFWEHYHHRHTLHHVEVRRRANRACNLWRNHREAEATEIARHCDPVNLALATFDVPLWFRRRSRLDVAGYVALCTAAGKPRGMIADILYHLRYENRPVETVGDLTPVCGCTIAP